MDFSINIYNSYRILLIINFIFAFFLINGHFDFKINAIGIISNQTTKNNFIYGIVNSSIPKDKFDSWIATGNWSLYLKNNSPIFSLKMGLLGIIKYLILNLITAIPHNHHHMFYR
jgi:hypothetical protein